MSEIQPPRRSQLPPPQDDAFRVWLDRQPTRPGHLGFKSAIIKQGPQVIKTVSVADYGDKDTGEVRRRQITVRTCPRDRSDPGYDFANPTVVWSCENDEVDRLLAFLTSNVDKGGRFRLVDTDSPAATLLNLGREADVDALAKLLRGRDDIADIVSALAGTAPGRQAAESAVLAQRRALVAELQVLAAEPGTTETDMQRAMGSAYWLFGGRYVGLARRDLFPLDQHDIPLLSADGTLHIVELKGPHIPRLVRRHRNHHIVGNDVHEAVSQAINYLRAADELGPGITVQHDNEFGTRYDLVRVFATVVIGHPFHVLDTTPEQVERTVRTYNAHLSRVEVVTWATLLNAAEQALRFEEQTVATEAEQVEAPASAPSVYDVWSEAPLPDPWSNVGDPWA